MWLFAFAVMRNNSFLTNVSTYKWKWIQGKLIQALYFILFCPILFYFIYYYYYFQYSEQILPSFSSGFLRLDSWIRVGVIPRLPGVHSRICIIQYTTKTQFGRCPHLLTQEGAPGIKRTSDDIFGICKIHCFYFSLFLLSWLCRSSQGNNSACCSPSADADTKEDHAVIHRAFSPPASHGHLRSRGWLRFSQQGAGSCPGCMGPDLHWEQNEGLPELILGFVITPAHHCALWLAWAS